MREVGEVRSRLGVSAKMKCTILALKTVEKLSVERWTLHTPKERHIGDVAEVAVMLLAC